MKVSTVSDYLSIYLSSGYNDTCSTFTGTVPHPQAISVLDLQEDLAIPRSVYSSFENTRASQKYLKQPEHHSCWVQRRTV